LRPLTHFSGKAKLEFAVHEIKLDDELEKKEKGRAGDDERNWMVFVDFHTPPLKLRCFPPDIRPFMGPNGYKLQKRVSRH
jgi:hypothetical protein